jgi:hypothetical protein
MTTGTKTKTKRKKRKKRKKRSRSAQLVLGACRAQNLGGALIVNIGSYFLPRA